MAAPDADSRRLAFGRVAELYHRVRPPYPDAVIEELVSFSGLEPGGRVLDVGAGTGKATVALAERGLEVLALEPDPAMAELARRNTAAYPRVTVTPGDFESFHPPAPFDALVCAQAWHWIDPVRRYQLAAAALLPGGALAAMWNLPDWEPNPLRRPLCEVYARFAAELSPGFPMHPASEPLDIAGDWHGEIAAADAFAAPTVERHRFSLSYATADYLALLETHQDHILLPDAVRGELLAAVADVLDRAGGSIRLDLVTQLCLARRNEHV